MLKLITQFGLGVLVCCFGVLFVGFWCFLCVVVFFFCLFVGLFFLCLLLLFVFKYVMYLLQRYCSRVELLLI